jgi:DNA-binding NarL/FixJ family response regulator
MARAMGEEGEIAASLTALGLGLQLLGDRVAANRAHEESISLCRAAGDRPGLARGLLMSALNRRGDARSFEESLRLYRDCGDRWGEASVLHGLGTTALAQKHSLVAWDYFAAGLQAAAALDHGVLMVMHLDGLSAASMGQRRFRDGTRMLAAADALRARIGVTRTPGMLETRSASLAQAERALGTRILAEALAEGESLTVATILSSLARPIPTRAPAMGLTRRELEVLRLVAEGLTNAEVADRLVISVRTVDAHLVSVYGKLGISSRSAATRYAIEQGLVELGT